MATLLREGGERDVAADLFAAPFNPADPVNTPRGLNVGNPQVQEALLAAIAELRHADIRMNASLRNYQYVERDGVRIPIHGGPSVHGQYNMIENREGWVPQLGWPDVNRGTSIMLFAQFTDEGPKGRSIMTYSQSGNPNSPFYTDQTRMFSEKKTKEILFSEEQIAADPNLIVEKICVLADGTSRR